MVAGDVVNTAARLQAGAPVDGILVGESTYRATERTIEYAEGEPVRAKGKSEPIPVWEALAARARYGVDVQQSGGAALVGRREELAPLAEKATMKTRWLEAARAYAAGVFEEAAGIHAEMGAVVEEAYARLRAAEAYVRAGRPGEADAQLQRALAFYRSVGATAYIWEAESLFAASA